MDWKSLIEKATGDLQAAKRHLQILENVPNIHVKREISAIQTTLDSSIAQLLQLENSVPTVSDQDSMHLWAIRRGLAVD